MSRNVISIGVHPCYREHFSGKVLSGDTGVDLTDEELAIFFPDADEQAEVTASLDLRNSFGNSACFQCTKQIDSRPRWLQIFSFFRARRGDYICGASVKVKFPIDPVTGDSKYSERQLSCTEVNPDGKCKHFDIAMPRGPASSKLRSRWKDR